MIGVYTICFILFPMSIFVQIKRCKEKDVLLDKNDTDIIKGVAACLVILCHLVVELRREITLSFPLNVFWLTGAMGVLLFFFVSGYGIWKEYSPKKPGMIFWRKRFLHMYLPCILIQFVFALIKMVQRDNFELSDVLYETFFYAWFINAILIQYIVFFVAWLFARGRQNAVIVWDFLLNILVTIMFYILKFNARWYNSLWMFPIGMIIAYKERTIIVSLYRRWIRYLILCFILFIGCGAIRTYAFWGGKSAGTDILKVFSGVALSLLIILIFLRVRCCSVTIRYIGKRSMFFYLIHIELLSVIGVINGISALTVFYSVMVLTFLIVEIVYRIYTFCMRCEQKRDTLSTKHSL